METTTVSTPLYTLPLMRLIHNSLTRGIPGINVLILNIKKPVLPNSIMH